MDGVGAGGPGGTDDRLDVEQVQRVRALGRGRDRADPEPLAGPLDPRDDLAPIGDEERPDRVLRGGRGDGGAGLTASGLRSLSP